MDVVADKIVADKMVASTLRGNPAHRLLGGGGVSIHPIP